MGYPSNRHTGFRPGLEVQHSPEDGQGFRMNGLGKTRLSSEGGNLELWADPSRLSRKGPSGQPFPNARNLPTARQMALRTVLFSRRAHKSRNLVAWGQGCRFRRPLCNSASELTYGIFSTVAVFCSACIHIMATSNCRLHQGLSWRKCWFSQIPKLVCTLPRQGFRYVGLERH